MTPQQAASILLQTRFASAIGARDVLYWKRGTTFCFAFQGPAAKFERSIFQQRSYNNRGFALDMEFQRAFGCVLTLQTWPGSTQVRSFQSDIGQTMSEGADTDVSEVFEGLGRILKAELGVRDGHEALIVTIIESEGSPHVPGQDVTQYWSAKKQKLLSSAKPKGLIRVLTNEGTFWGIDPCLHAPKCPSAKMGVAIRKGSSSWLVTHCLHLDRTGSESIAKSIRSCGGLLYPSLAVGNVPATPFGSVCLVADVGSLLSSIKPYRVPRTTPKVIVYNTDAWTVKTTEVLSSMSIALFDQLTGNYEVDAYYGRHAHMASLGPHVEITSHLTGQDVKIMQSSSQLASRLSRLGRAWPRGISALDESRQDEDRYPYLEGKAGCVMPLTDFPLCVCPEPTAPRAKGFLMDCGFTGQLVTVPVSAAELEKIDHKSTGIESYRYAWKVRDAVIAWAESRGQVHDLMT